MSFSPVNDFLSKDTLKNARMLAGLSQQQLSVQAGVSFGQIRRLETSEILTLNENIECASVVAVILNSLFEGEIKFERADLELLRVYQTLKPLQRSALREFIRTLDVDNT